MAIYHCSIKIISRGKGKSAVAAAAYRAGELIKNDYDGIVHDYTRKGDVVHTEIILPEYAPVEYYDRSVLWNAVEKIEKAKNSQLAREIELALPVELSREQNISLVREYVQQHFVSAGMCADVCIHDKDDGNPHAHVMLTMRPFEIDGSWGAKQRKEYVFDNNGEKIYDKKKRQYKCKSVSTTDWNEQTKAEEWRAAWADAVNTVLERQNISERVDHRSYSRQGIDKIPTIHLGVAASQMERKGISTERGNMNRIIASINQKLRQSWEKIIYLKDWLKEAIMPAAPPAFVSVLQGVLEGDEQQHQYGKIRNLKMAKSVLNFFQENGISKLSELQEKVSEIADRYDNARYNLNVHDRRVDTLKEHIRKGETYNAHKNIYAEYQKLRPRKQPKFYEAHRTELMLFESASRYFKEHYIKPDFSINDWETERSKLINSRGKVYREYNVMKTQFEDAYTVQRGANQIARELNPQPQRKPRSRGMER